MSDNIVLQLQDITKKFGDTEVLRGIDLSVARGEFLTLLGSSGCGKTTTLRIIAGLEAPDNGRIFLEGCDVTDLAPNMRNVNTVFQNYALFPHMSVEANIGYPLRLRKMNKTKMQAEIKKSLELVQLQGFEKRMPTELSGGQRQRVAIARAVIGNPKVLLLDEPLGALDLQLRRAMQIELKRIQKQLGITFIYITHDQEEALNMSDRIAVMYGGHFLQIDTPDGIYDRPQTTYVAKFVGNANIISGKVGEKTNQDGKKQYILETEDGEIEFDPAQAVLEIGQARQIAIRSEYVEMVPGEEPRENALAATVVDKSFVAGQLRIAAKTQSGTEIVQSRHGINSSITIGDRVFIQWSAQHAVMVEEV